MSCSDVSPEARANALDAARDSVHKVVFGNAMVLQLDLDSHDAFDEATALLTQFKKHLEINSALWCKSKTEEHRHIYVYLEKPMDRGDRIAWQAFLGSDRTREALNYMWYLGDNAGECFLVEMKDCVLHHLDI